MATERAVNALSAPQRAQRRNDLLLAADSLRAQIGADLARLQPAGDRVLAWADAALWVRRQWSRASPPRRRLAAVIAAAGGIAGAGGIGAYVLRHWRWLRNALVAWRVWRQLRA